MSTLAKRLCAWAALLTALASGTPAQAGAPTKVVVTRATGGVEDAMTAALERALTGRASIALITADRWSAAARELKLPETSPEAQARIAARVGADAILTAQVSQDDRWVAEVRVLQASSGRALEVWRVRSQRLARLPELVQRELWQKLGPALEAAREAADDGGTSEASTDEAPLQRVVLESIGGTLKGGEEQLAAALRAAGVELVDVEEARRLAGGALQTEDERLTAARSAEIRAWVSGWLDKARKGKLSGELELVDATSNEVVATLSLEAKTAKLLTKGLADRLVAALPRTRVPPPPRRVAPPEAPAAREPAVEAELPAPATLPRAARNEVPVEVGVGAAFFTRNLSYVDDLFGALRPYQLGGAPALRLSVAWYPGAHFSRGTLSHVGLEARASYALGLSSRNAAGVEFPTRALSYEASLRGRLPAGRHAFGLAVGYGRDLFDIQPAGAAQAGVPAVAYGYARGGLDAQLWLTESIGVKARAGWRQLLSTGGFQTTAWFPRQRGAGIDAALAGTLAVAEGLEVELGAELRRYFFALEPEPGDANVAGGALDQYLVGTLGLSWALGG
jgi:hypothetical protein